MFCLEEVTFIFYFWKSINLIIKYEHYTCGSIKSIDEGIILWVGFSVHSRINSEFGSCGFAYCTNKKPALCNIFNILPDLFVLF